MLNLQKIKEDYCKRQIQEAYQRTYSDMEKGVGNIIVWTAHLALENIANSDALYHDVEHTIMVTLAGQSILEGKHLSEGGVSPTDWAHFMIALLCHDIGYVKGICADDAGYLLATGIGKKKIKFPEGSTDAILAPYHIDRSKRFVLERFGKKMLMESGGLLDAELIASYIEMTRFPVPDDDRHKDTSGFPGMARA
ncbi:MAG: metal-dependent phosphohydrolase, partial [Desulfosarcina sp.]|nr:metal-dependent phosphohydrolase [Desulfosarcina sp.]MBC2766280.1 metal-dependent phosphohydrolase [Desulfosarcina sp.]